MRFLKGCKVEVLKNKQVPPGEWHCAKIISGNGHTYSVMYEGSLEITAEVVVERVPRKAIRPCPPPMETMDDWAVGDVAEVFNVGSWRMAMILKVLGGDYHLVRLLGSSEKFKVHKSNIRVRQVWQDDKWVVIRKGPSNSLLVKSNEPSSLNFHQMTSEFLPHDTRKKMQAGNTCLAAQDNTCLQEAHVVSSRTLKRKSPYCSTHTEAYSVKMRGIEKESERQRVISESTSSLLKKVDAVAYPQANLGEKYTHDSFNKQTTGYFDLERVNQNGSILVFHGRILEPIHCDGDASFVGSCSVVTDSSNRLSGHILSCPPQDANTLNSDADSCYDCRDGEGRGALSLKDNLATSIDRLELHDYRSTLEAIYASGPLSWEQEALLTNLRVSFNISNDEHLMEIRNLKSAGYGLHLS
ncbi:uncharacterized protein LOC142621960 isoform X1 [Castanea sativa]|uniref:uncharacterized protein LOC142621960 isoform X1 n=1 Tax=Castanea sativa TaxID=21020 RepID=UPI003F64E3F3